MHTFDTSHLPHNNTLHVVQTTLPGPIADCNYLGMAPKALLKKPAAAHVAAVDNVLTEENVTELIQGKSLDEKLVLYREWANTQI